MCTGLCHISITGYIIEFFLWKRVSHCKSYNWIFGRRNSQYLLKTVTTKKQKKKWPFTQYLLSW